MVYWLFILALAVEIFLYVICMLRFLSWNIMKKLEVAIPVTCIIILVSTVIIILANITAKHEKIALESSYNTLMEYKSVTDYLQNEHYITDVISWNITITSGKSIQRDFLIGIFIPNIYDDFDIITLKED